MIGVAIWPSAPILWLVQQSGHSLGIESAVSQQLEECLTQMRHTLEIVGQFDRILIVGPCAPRPVGPSPVSAIADTENPLSAPVIRPVAEPAPSPVHDPLADLDPRWSVSTSITARLLRGFDYRGPIDAIEVGILPSTASAGVPTPDLTTLSVATAEVNAAATAIASTSQRTLLVVVGDGAAAHGDQAPLARDDRSADYDLDVVRALTSGRTARIAQALAARDGGCPLGLRLGSLGFWPLSTLAVLGLTGPAAVHFDAAVLGVGYQVSSMATEPQRDRNRG